MLAAAGYNATWMVEAVVLATSISRWMTVPGAR